MKQLKAVRSEANGESEQLQGGSIVEDDLARFVEYEKRAYALTLAVRQQLLSHHRERTAASLRAALASVELSISEGPLSKSLVDGEWVHWIDYEKQHVFSTFGRKTQMQLPEFVRLIRGETDDDSRPNKALEIPSNTPASTSYQHRHKWEAIVRHDARPSWKNTFHVQDNPPRNLTSAQRTMIHLGRYKKEQQLCPKMLESHTTFHIWTVVLLMITLSDDSGMITYNGPHDLATRIMVVENEFPGIPKLMSGDVAGAFRHLAIHADHVRPFAGTIPELGLLVIDLCCPFGWLLSPQHCWTAGGAISHLYASAAPKWRHQPQKGARTFDTKTWCDDHNLIEPDIGSRLVEANLALRRSVTTILGPGARREDARIDVEHAPFNVSNAPEKNTKALCRIDDMLRREGQNTTNYSETTWKPSSCRDLSVLTWGPRRYSAIRVTVAARDDLYWFRSILHYTNLNAAPLSRFSGS
ncbi:hypothetical protein PHMEG_00015135 [Phytophthora megakarya]|uniref:Cleavage induced protein n=1 Tax=Phytophthora megakarya TaxID=4795 RepID=A0A225W2I7_9STRA|nr:hypothetical protein PHMEG_00015135 [Phytophthora megakarya]